MAIYSDRTCKALTNVFSDKECTFCGLLENTSDDVFEPGNLVWKPIEVLGKRECVIHSAHKTDQLSVNCELGLGYLNPCSQIIASITDYIDHHLVQR